MKPSTKRKSNVHDEGAEEQEHTEQAEPVVAEDDESSGDEEVVVVEGDIMTHKAIEIVSKTEDDIRSKQSKRAGNVAKHVKFLKAKELTGDFDLDEAHEEETLPKTFNYTAKWVIDGIVMGF